MSNFKKFYNENKNKNKLQSSSTELAVRISSSLSLELSSNNEKEKFSKDVATLAYSDEVLTELNNEIGTVKETESEDEFVSRAKSSLADILRKKLLK